MLARTMHQFGKGSWMAAACAAMVTAAAPARADVKAGVDAWMRNDFATAVKEWQGPLERGDADAQFNMAQAYKLGQGVPQDLARAEMLYGKAAAQGHVRAADNYGLLLFQRGEHVAALPYLQASAARGEPRAQYLYGISLFNGDGVAKDWVRAYALVSLARQQELPQALTAMSQMDQYIPLDQRQKGVQLATELAAQAESNRQRTVTAMDLGTRVPAPATQRAPAALAVASARTPVNALPAAPSPMHAPAAPPAAAPTAARAVPAPAPAQAASGAWKIQLGAFGVAANADALWQKLHGRPELAGHARINVKSGSVTRLLAGGYSAEEARTVCSKLTGSGIACLAVSN